MSIDSHGGLCGPMNLPFHLSSLLIIMEISLTNLDTRANLYDIKSALEKVLHSPGQPPFNFLVLLNQSKTDGFENDGTGSLILPSKQTGRDFLRKIKANEKKVVLGPKRRRVHFDQKGRAPHKGTIEMLRKVPYQSPDIDKQMDRIRQELKSRRFRIDKLQVGCWKSTQSPSQSRVFAIEWEKEYTSIGNAVLGFDYDKKVLRIQMGEPLQDEIAYSVILKFAIIRDIWVGSDIGEECMCFLSRIMLTF